MDYIRSFKVGQYALFDLVVSYAGMYYLGRSIGIDTSVSMLLTLPIGVAIHSLLGINTPMTAHVLDQGTTPMRLIVIAMTLMAIYMLHTSYVSQAG
jgi:hypothetical protein